MEIPTVTLWPENAPSEMGNPRSIEKFLRDEIKARQITLIGELDLVAPTSYAGINWSLYELASYLANKNIIKNSLTVELMENWGYPATLAIWTVGKAQSAEDGAIKMWDLADYSPGQLAHLANMFSRSIQLLELPIFDGELLGAQKHVQLARIHAMIPDFAAERYSEIIHRAVKYNQPKFQILNNVIEDTIISKGVRRLFSARQEIGLDLIERSFNYLAYGYELDLPERLRSRLNRNGIQKKSSVKAESFPSIVFIEYAGAIEVRGGNTWQVVDEDGNEIDQQNIPASNVYATKDGAGKIKILDLSSGYLLFDIKGNLIYGNTLPSDGGFLFWRNDVKLITEMEGLDDGNLPHWPEWSFTFFYDLSEIVLELPDSTEKRFERRKSVAVLDFKVPNLQDAWEGSIYSSYPVIEEKGHLTLTDHLTDTQIELINHEGPVVSEPGGQIDMTIASGLGKSRSFKGLVIPNIAVGGLENAMTIGSVAHIDISLPIDWHFTYPEEIEGKTKASLEFKVEPSQEPMLLKVKDQSAEEHFLGLEVPILSWSVEFSNRESVTVASSHRVDVTQRRFVRAIILHGVNEYVPILKVGEVPIPGRKRGADARYDLRLLSDVHGDEESRVGATWNYANLDLIHFVKPASKKMHRVDLKDLATEAIAKKIISEEDWNSYQAEVQQKSVDLRNLLRRQRGN